MVFLRNLSLKDSWREAAQARTSKPLTKAWTASTPKEATQVPWLEWGPATSNSLTWTCKQLAWIWCATPNSTAASTSLKLPEWWAPKIPSKQLVAPPGVSRGRWTEPSEKTSPIKFLTRLELRWLGRTNLAPKLWRTETQLWAQCLWTLRESHLLLATLIIKKQLNNIIICLM